MEENTNQNIENLEKEHVENSIPNNYNNSEWYLKTRNIIYYFLGVIEVLLVVRLIFRLLGANANNVLVSALYSFTSALVLPFVGIFRAIMPTGTAQYIIEPSTILAMITYALMAYGIIRFLRVTVVEG